MKTRFFLIMIMLLILSSCGAEGGNSSKEKISSSCLNSSSSISSVGNKDKEVSTPSLMLDEQTGIVTWNYDNNATYYNYIINDGEIKTTTSNTIKLNDKSNISVQAANSTYESSWSNAITYFDTSDVIVGGRENVNIYFHNTSLTSKTIKTGSFIEKPNAPDKNNYIFDNWYKNPFYQELFDFSQPIYHSTIIYANYIPNDLINNVYFWIKANPKISATIMSSSTNSDWHFIPLKENSSQTLYKEFIATITVNGASISDPAKFLVMDGFDDNEGRTYWKNNGNDFTITSDGTYNIYFSLETQYKIGSNVVHAKYEKVNSRSNVESNKQRISTPFINIDLENNIASWEETTNAKYEVIIDNKTPQLISKNYIEISKGSHICVRTVIDENNKSNWSLPQANLNYIEVELENNYVYLYFLNSDENAIKVKKGDLLNEAPIPNKEGFTFLGWYLDISLKTKATFPYEASKNTVFYPKCEFNEKDYATKQYYKLVDENNNIISGLTWNIDNFDFKEYNTQKVELLRGKTYYVNTLDDSKSWGPYKVDSDGSYVIYFSEDNLWNINTINESNVYIAQQSMDIYFSNSKGWSGTIYAYAFNKASGEYMKAWPGMQMTYVKTNSYGQKIYTIELDTSKYDYVIFTNGSSQTIDISLENAYSGIGYYATDEKDGNNYKVGSYTFA